MPAASLDGARQRFALLQVGLWSLYGLVHYAAALPAVSEEERWHLAGWKAIRAATGLVISSVLPFLYRRLPGGIERVPVVVAKLGTVSYLAGLFWSILDRSVLVTVVATTALEVNWYRFPRGFELDYVFVLLAWSAGYLAVRYATLAAHRRREALEQRVLTREAQLVALTAQLQPHFLFNTLNSIRSLIAEDVEGARLMITRLSSFLRYSLSAAEMSTVASEIDAVRAYLAIEEARFENRLEVSIETSPAAGRCLVPTLILQPLVENAVRHGEGSAGGPLRIRVHVERGAGPLRIVVANTGSLGMAGEPVRPETFGLANVRDRLAHIYGDRQELSLSERDGWVEAAIEIREPQEVGNDTRVDRR